MFSQIVFLKIIRPRSAVGNCLTADPGVASSIPARSHTFIEMDHEIISTAILLPSADSRRVFVSDKRKYVQEVLVNRLVKLSRKKVWLGELTIPTVFVCFVALRPRQQLRSWWDGQFT